MDTYIFTSSGECCDSVFSRTHLHHIIYFIFTASGSVPGVKFGVDVSKT